MIWRTALLGFLSVALLALSSDPARAGETSGERSWYAGKLDLDTGFDYSTGDYGQDESTDVRAVPFSLRYRFQNLAWSRRDDIRLRASIAYLSVTGPERGGASPGARGTDRGLGDVNLRVTYAFRPRPLWIPDLLLSERVKVPTASTSKNLGTGEFDYTTDITLLKRIPLRRDRPPRTSDTWTFRYVTPYAIAGYKVVGKSPHEVLDNAWRFGGGATLNVTRRFDVGVNYFSRESTIPGQGSSQVVSPFTIYRVTPWLQIMPYARFGVGTRSPDWGTGMLIQLTRGIE